MDFHHRYGDFGHEAACQPLHPETPVEEAPDAKELFRRVTRLASVITLLKEVSQQHGKQQYSESYTANDFIRSTYQATPLFCRLMADNAVRYFSDAEVQDVNHSMLVRDFLKRPYSPLLMRPSMSGGEPALNEELLRRLQKAR
ncbi:MAG: hypothetical protein A3F10_02525 [Coxiella sp. RIFCSPHIGHO2_12_FULL_42_15]|nr:MAG: hypothetical protein A3F10_02525 [Coxiella sp. RIFCSPHIGHO2_12_FULL_42_15]